MNPKQKNALSLKIHCLNTEHLHEILIGMMKTLAGEEVANNFHLPIFSSLKIHYQGRHKTGYGLGKLLHLLPQSTESLWGHLCPTSLTAKLQV